MATYGGTSTYKTSGSGGGSVSRKAATGTTTGWDEQGFIAAAEQARLAGGQVSPAEAAKFGMPMNRYNQQYGETRFWNADGSLTPAGQAAGLRPAPPVNEELNNALFPTAPQVTVGTQNVLPTPTFTNVGPAPALNYAPGQAPQFHAYDYLKDIESSPTYQYQVDQGLKDLTKYLSSQGLLESGFQGEQAVNVINKVRAEEAEAARRYAESAAERSSTWQINEQNRRMQYDINNARNTLDASIAQAEQANNFALADTLRRQKVELDNLDAQLKAQIANAQLKGTYDLAGSGMTWDMMQWEPEFQQSLANDYYNRMFQTLSLIMNQNPLSVLAGGSENLANLISQSGALAGGGGGGRGGGSSGGGASLPPIPSQPYYGNITPISITGNYNTNTQLGNLLGTVLGQIIYG